MEAVEAVNGTLAQMRAEFQERMARFEAGHSSTPSKLASGGTSALAQDYWAFKAGGFSTPGMRLSVCSGRWNSLPVIWMHWR
ncbi:hypothetical protein SFRURICE_005684 [Spodoptera frugiperda]|nr:hypothetical protein SFRURICE_005684 [Spodoptera frugiperda]